MSTRVRVIEALERRRFPATAALLAWEVDAPPSTVRHVLSELVDLGAVSRSKPSGAYRYQLVRG